MEIFGCIGIVAVIWVFSSPILTLVLWNRLRELEEQVQQLTRHSPARSARKTAAQEQTRTGPRMDSSALEIEGERHSRFDLAPKPTVPSSRPEDVPEEISIFEPVTAADDVSGLVQPLEVVEPVRETIEIVEPVTPVEQFESTSDVAAAAMVSADDVLEEVDSTPQRHYGDAVGKVSDRPTVTQPAAARPTISLEEILAGKWLAYVGALAVMIGAGFGLKYAIDNQWLGPVGRVVMGVVSGLLCFAGGAFAMRREYRFLGQGLTGAALGVLYLSFYAAFDWYHIIPFEWAFAGMVLTTAGGLAFAHAFDSQPTAVLGMIGGFLTPAMLPPGTDSLWELFPYLLLLDVGVLGVSSVRRWTGLQIQVFFGTILTWMIWYFSYYTQARLYETLGFLTVFFVLFAALGVIHNIVQKRVAYAADFFLIFATPTVYFTALYCLTYDLWPYKQGYFALAMVAVYAVFALSCARVNPAGRSVTAALAGLAGTFLVLAPPLSLTGHWVTVAWIMESVLLVELGLRFEMKSLSWTGLSLLAKIQVILIIYGIGTLLDPIDFQTAFVRQTLQLSVPRETLSQSWTEIFNNRSYSYLVDIFALSILAWEFRRRLKANTPDDPYGPRQADLELWLASGVPIVALAMGLLELYVWGAVHNWPATTTLSACAIWTSLIAVPAVAWAVRIGPRGIERVGGAIFTTLGMILFFETVWTIDPTRSMTVNVADGSSLWLLNVRGAGFLASLLALFVTSVVYAFDPARHDLEDGQTKREELPISPADLFSSMAYWLGLVMVLLETYVWSATHHWLPGTLLSAFAIWTAAFALGLILWQTDWKSLSARLKGSESELEPTPPVTRDSGPSSEMLTAIFSILGAFLIGNAFLALQAVSAMSPQEPNTVRWLLNPRGISFLVACAVGGLSAWLLQRDRQGIRSRLSLTLGSSTFLAGLTCVLLETLTWGISREFRFGAILSLEAIWSAVFAAGLVLWRVRWGSKSLDQLVVFSFLVVGGFLLCNSLGTFASAEMLRRTGGAPLDDLWLLNPRGLSLLLAIGTSTLAAVLYRVLATHGLPSDSRVSKELGFYSLGFGVTAFLGGLLLVLLETVVWGMPRGWLFGTLVSTAAMWTAIFAGGLAIFAASSRSRELDGLVMGMFVLLGGLVAVAGVMPFDQGIHDQTAEVDPSQLEWWFLNPRGIGYLFGIAASGLAAAFYRRLEMNESVGPGSVMTLSQMLGISAYLAGLALVTTESFAQGTMRHWLTGTSLAVTIAWTLYSTGTIVAGIYWRAATVRILALSLLFLTIGKVFLIDIWHLETVIRVFAFMSLGVALMLISFLYRRFRERIREWVLPAVSVANTGS